VKSTPPYWIVRAANSASVVMGPLILHQPRTPNARDRGHPSVHRVASEVPHAHDRLRMLKYLPVRRQGPATHLIGSPAHRDRTIHGAQLLKPRGGSFGLRSAPPACPAIATPDLRMVASCLSSRTERDSPKNHANHL
jgi:hypothetical protein